VPQKASDSSKTMQETLNEDGKVQRLREGQSLAGCLEEQVGHFPPEEGAKSRVTIRPPQVASDDSAPFIGVEVRGKEHSASRTVLIHLLLFCGSAGAIILGYSSFSLGVDLHQVLRIIRSVPVLSTALFLTAVPFASLVFAFYLSKGDRNSYQEQGLTYSVVSALLIALTMLPGASSLPDGIYGSPSVMTGFIVVSQAVVAMALADFVWARGGRLG
jgi:hypothetical protein